MRGSLRGYRRPACPMGGVRQGLGDQRDGRARMVRKTRMPRPREEDLAPSSRGARGAARAVLRPLHLVTCRDCGEVLGWYRAASQGDAIERAARGEGYASQSARVARLGALVCSELVATVV